MPLAHSHRFTDGDLEPAAGRYRLIASGSCPWCRRVLIARRLLGLVDAIPVSWSYGKGADGFWELTDETGEPGVDPALHARSLAEVYEGVDGYTPPPTVPTLVDTQTGEVVSDDSGSLLFDLATAWWDLHREGAPDLYPLDRRNSTDAWDEWLTQHVNGPYSRATHSEDEEVAAEAANTVLLAFDVIDTVLARATHMEASREGALTIQDVPPLSAVVSVEQFLCGAQPTGSDIRLFTFVQAYEYGGRAGFPGGVAPSISFWPALARWFRALESRSGWVGPEERSALGIGEQDA
ncbi:glutathione S-transferase family protein [Actinomyces haliotis]|uniref:glutathione transferase n=1 Tax=Actinomyces haliotis TaxID=1280843 RepID=UPI00188FEDDE|nr:glutathione transferase [Actinomyces haliotis]